MSVQIVRYTLLGLILLSFHSLSFADTVFKWIDQDGVVHYSQLPSTEFDADTIKTLPSPEVTPEQSKAIVDNLIQQQELAAEAEAENKHLKAEENEKNRLKTQYCHNTRADLQQYQNNPRALVRQTDGNIERIDETQRQARILELTNNLNKHCQ